MTALQTFFFLVFPYVCLTSFVIGHIWRYKYDKFGWTTRSSQWYESKLLRWASPMFHFGLLGVLLGHFAGLVIPESWTNALGINEDLYHLMAVILGSVAGVVMVIGLIGLIWRRRSTPSVFRATTNMDKLMYVMLGTVVGLGLYNTFGWQLFGSGYNYRETVSIWFRGIFYFNPDVALMTEAPLSFQLHAIAAFSLLAIWPFTRLVHVLSAPVGYLWRPYVVYRSKDPHNQPGNRDPRPGWERPGLSPTKK
ncbi:MAG: respiratory nitrate reductase subunit gamma [Candidatus Nanopelagicales bacterium]|nr:respiratory nitrate reductase subunit gamma [Candidatus Nanopelagicales bacterium]